MANNFNFYSPTEVIFGKDTHRETGKYIRKYGGSRILILYGSERVFTTGLMGEITESIKKEGLTFAFLGGIVPNPHLSKVYEGIGLGREMQADFLLAVGGGSVIDTAKAVAYVWRNRKKMSGRFLNTPAPRRNASRRLPF